MNTSIDVPHRSSANHSLDEGNSKCREMGICHMHHCLYCSKPCIETTIFCDECRASLLKRLYPSGAVPATPLSPPVPYQSPCTPLPARPRPLLPVFIMLGAIALITGGILLAANILQQQHISLTDRAAVTGTSIVLFPRADSTTRSGETQTPAVSSVAGTPIPTSTISGTGTNNTSTTTSVPGAGTPTPASVPATATPITCLLQAAPTHLSFTATLLQPDPPGQSIALKTTGNCGKPTTWEATADSSWIQLSSSTGSDNGSGSAVTVSARSNQIVGVYTAHITFTAVDSNGITVPGSPQTINVTLTVIG